MYTNSAGVLQGSVLGPALFTAYVSPIGCLIESIGTEFHANADDTQIYTTLMTDTEPGLERLSKYTVALQYWFWKNDLLLNPDKSDVTLYGTRPGLRRPGLPSSISIADCAVNVSERLKILGALLEATLSFDDHITSVVRACNFGMRALRHIRCSVSQDITNTMCAEASGAGQTIATLYCSMCWPAKTSKSSIACPEQFGTNSLRHRHQQTSRLWP